jgi:peptidoglycan/LPS O-acetylase OafA/YrhL
MLGLAQVCLERDRLDARARLDLAGTFTLVPGLVGVVLGLMQSQQWGCGSPAVAALLVVGVALVAAVLDKFSCAWLLPGYVAMAVGLAFVMTPASTDAMNCAAAREHALASGTSTAYYVGAAVTSPTSTIVTPTR